MQSASERFWAENSALFYINKVDASIIEESDRAVNCLDKSTEKMICAVLDEELITKHIDPIVEVQLTLK